MKKWVYSVFIIVLFLGVGQSIAFEKQERATELVNSWKVLDDAGIKTKSIDDVKYVDDYLKKNPKAKVADEIADAGGYGKWKSATKGALKLLNKFNSVESLIRGAGKLNKVKAGMQGFVKGDGASIFKAISQGGTRQANGTILMKDGTKLFNHFSTKTGVYTIDINRAGQVFKIRVTP